MTPDPDALLQQLTQAGLYPQQIAQLQRQYQLAQGFMQPQEAQGRQVGGTYVASSPLEHLSNALRPVIGAYMQRQAMNREGELTGQLSSGRQAFARALQDSSGHQGELMPGSAGDQQRMQQLSMLGSLSGDPGMQHAAQAYQQQSVLQNTLRHQQETERQAAAQLAETTRHNQASEPKYAVNSVTGREYNVRTGEEVPGTGAGNTGPAPLLPGSRQYSALQKELGAFRTHMNPYEKTSGDTYNQWQKVAASNVLETLMTNGAGELENLTPQQQREAATSLAKLLGAGGGMSEGQVNELDAPTLKRWLANKIQYFTSQPQGTEAYGIFQNMLTTARRERDTAKSTIKKQLADQLGGYPLMLQYQPQAVWNLLAPHGLRPDDFDSTGRYVGAPIGLTPREKTAAGGAPAQPPAGMPHPHDSAAVEWAKKNPNDPRAQKILQINGVAP